MSICTRRCGNILGFYYANRMNVRISSQEWIKLINANWNLIPIYARLQCKYVTLIEGKRWISFWEIKYHSILFSRRKNQLQNIPKQSTFFFIFSITEEIPNTCFKIWRISHTSLYNIATVFVKFWKKLFEICTILSSTPQK